MREVLAVGGRMGDRQKGGRGYCRQHSAHFYLRHSSLGNHGYRQEHVPLVVWGSVRCVFSLVQDARRTRGPSRWAITLLLLPGGVGRKEMRRWGVSKGRGGGCERRWWDIFTSSIHFSINFIPILLQNDIDMRERNAICFPCFKRDGHWSVKNRERKTEARQWHWSLVTREL